MASFRLNSLAFSIEMQGGGHEKRSNFSLRHGTRSEIKTAEYEFLFNLNGEIKFIRGLNMGWPHPAAQLKRTDGNDWVYYSVGDDSSDQGIISWLGEYYLPCLPYPSNSVWDFNYFADPAIMNAFAAWSQLYANIYGARTLGLPPRVREFLGRVIDNNDSVLVERSRELRSITNGRVSVLPPDTRHVDYEVIPLMIADGCLYHCKFCCVQSADKYKARSKDDILEQIMRLKVFYGRDIENYNALFLGNHDALAAGPELICMAASSAYEAFGFNGARAQTPMLFLFGSVDSLCKADNSLFEYLNRLPFYTYINIGCESIDASTLAYLQKPLTPSKVRAAFEKMLQINSGYANIEISANFLLGEQLSTDHYQSLVELLGGATVPKHRKGAIYLSPLKDNPKKRELLPQFYEIKNQSRLPAYIYLIQRL